MTDTTGSEFFDLAVPGQSLDFLVYRISPNGVIGTFANDLAAVKIEVGDEMGPLHAARVSSFSPVSKCFWASSRR